MARRGRPGIYVRLPKEQVEALQSLVEKEREEVRRQLGANIKYINYTQSDTLRLIIEEALRAKGLLKK